MGLSVVLVSETSRQREGVVRGEKAKTAPFLDHAPGTTSAAFGPRLKTYPTQPLYKGLFLFK